MNDELRNKQEANTPGKYYPGYTKPQSPPQQMDMEALMGLLKQIMGGVGKAFGPATRTFGEETYGKPKQVMAPPTPTAAPEEATKARVTEEQVKQGLSRYAKDSPLATQSAVLAQALNQLSPNIDPMTILALAIKESRAGKDLVGRKEGLNNPLNVMHHVGGQRRLVNYPDLQTALTGGPNSLEGTDSQGIINILNKDPRYEQFRQSGDPAELLKHFTPYGGENPDQSTQLRQLEQAIRYLRGE